MLFDWILALSPILLILLLMVWLRWGAAKAGPAGWILAILVAGLRFGAGLELVALAHVKALLLTLDVLFIIWTAFLMYRVADEAGAIGVLSKALPHFTADRGMQALLIGWAFASFLQGVGGFGVPTAVTAPLLVGLGFTPLASVVIPSIGHAWSVTFGSLASSFQALMAATGRPGAELAPPAALLLGMAGFGCGVVVVHAAEGTRSIRRLAFPVVFVGAVMAATQYLLATRGFWHLAGFGAGLAGLIAGMVIARGFQGDRSRIPEGAVEIRKVFLALAGYLVLILITVVVQLIEPVRAFLGQVVLRVPFPELQTGLGYTTPAEVGRVIHPFRHGGAILAYTSILSYLLYRRAGWYRPGAARKIVTGTMVRVLSSSLGIASMVAMAVIMAHAGMTDVLAQGLASGMSEIFPLVSPWIGALGAFMTGSNTNSNVVFALLQLRTAQLLGYSAPVILAAQTAGGAIGSVIAPAKVIVGASTAGMGGREGDILRRMLGYTIALILGLSGLIGIWTLTGG